MKRFKILQKGVSFCLVLILVLVLTACGQKQVMNQASEDGNFYYSNKDLGFSIVLPPSFQYYQTQRITEDDYVEIMFLVPTSDIDSFEEVSGYSKPITIRVYNSQVEDLGEFQEFGQKSNKYYVVRFWEDIPRDWQENWSNEVKEEILTSLEVK